MKPRGPALEPVDVDAADDDTLVERILRGEIELFAEIVRRHQRDLWKIVVHAGGDWATSEGLVQQSFSKAFERLAQYRRGDSLGHWLKAIGRNVVRDELRQSTREAFRLSRYRSHLQALNQDPSRAEETARQLEAALASCLDGLAPAAAQAVQLRYQDGLGLDRIAEALGRTLPATRQLLFRIRQILRDCVESKVGAP